MATHDEDFRRALADVARESEPILTTEEADVFSCGLRALNAREVRYVVGGAYAKHAYTGVWRDTKDLDLFLMPRYVEAALEALAHAGFETEVEFGHWLAKGHQDPYVIDLIFGTGHGQLRVSDSWFERARPVEIAGVEARLIPLEELIVSKAYIAERYRYDGADILHLIWSARGEVDWQRVLSELGENRGLLLWHLVLFDFVYPGHADYLPWDLMTRLFEEARQGAAEQRDPKSFRGTLLDPFAFVVDIEDRGYEDRRVLAPLVDERGALL